MAITEDITGGLQKLTWTWTCSSAGAVSETSTKQYNGAVVGLVTIPGTSDDAPTAAYDVTAADAAGVDILFGKGADRSATATEYVIASGGLGFIKSSTVAFSVANAGDIATGSVFVYILDLDKGVIG